MKAIVSAVLKECGLVFVSALVIIVAEFVVDSDKVLIANLNAHLEPDILMVINVPRAGVADHVTITRLDEERTVPEGFGRFGKAKTAAEVYAVVLHAQLAISIVFGQLRAVIG